MINPEENKNENLDDGSFKEIEHKKEVYRDKFKFNVPSDFMKSSTENSDSSEQMEQESSGKLNFNDIYNKD